MKKKMNLLFAKLVHIGFRRFLLLIILILIVTLFSTQSPYFLTAKNIIAIGVMLSVIGIICIGQTICVILKGFDLSVGYAAQVGGMTVALLVSKTEIPFGIAFAIAIIFGIAIGMVNGILITKVRMHSFIATLATGTFLGGLVFRMCNGYAVIIADHTFIALSTTKVLDIPLPIIILVTLYIMFYFVIKMTTFGRKVYSIGGNIEASKMAGIKIDRVQIEAYIISSALAAFAGVLLTSRMGAAQITAGQNYAINSIAAVILGGTGVIGGEGKLSGTLLGVLIIGVLTNGLVMIGVDQSFHNMVMGGVLVLSFLVNNLYYRFIKKYG